MESHQPYNIYNLILYILICILRGAVKPLLYRGAVATLLRFSETLMRQMESNEVRLSDQPLEARYSGEWIGVHGLIAEYAWRLDHGSADALHELFAEDGCLLGAGFNLCGIAAIRDWGRKRDAVVRTTRHVCSNLQIHAQLDGALYARSYVMVFRSESDVVTKPTLVFVGDYNDVILRDNASNRWLFSRRQLMPSFAAGPYESLCGQLSSQPGDKE